MKKNAGIQLVLAFVLLSFALSANTTPQIADKFIVDEAIFEINPVPLYKYVKIPDLTKAYDLHYNSSLSRGYIAHWMLWNDRLYIADIWVGPDGKRLSVPSSQLFGDEKYPVEATWFTGTIYVRIGERKPIEQDGSGLTAVEFEAIVHEFESGKLMSREIKKIIDYL